MVKNRNIPFGYCMVNGKYALNAPEAEAVRKIFADYIGGKSLKTIAAEMTVPYNTGKVVWNKNMVCRVLGNRKYVGENGYPQIITSEDQEENHSNTNEPRDDFLLMELPEFKRSYRE